VLGVLPQHLDDRLEGKPCGRLVGLLLVGWIGWEVGLYAYLPMQPTSSPPGLTNPLTNHGRPLTFWDVVPRPQHLPELRAAELLDVETLGGGAVGLM
jgi:hypothetical protein